MVSVEDLKARVFISCGQQRNTDEIEVAQEICNKLKAEGYDEPYIAVEEQTLKGVKENIFQRLSESEYFIFIDFKREPINDKEYRGSLFSNQELAIATFLDTEVIALQEDGVKKEDGILKFIQANCKPFTNRNQILDIITQEMEKQRWNPTWRNELILERDDKDYEDARDVRINRIGRYYHIKVKNLHQRKIAHDCVAYLESIKDLTTNEETTYELVEFKWKGVRQPRISIPPQRNRYLDAFHIYKDTPNIAHLGINQFVVDFEGYEETYRLTGPKTFDLTYIIFSENFTPARSTFRLIIGTQLNDIKFNKIK